MVNGLLVNDQTILDILKKLQYQALIIPECRLSPCIHPVNEYLDLILDQYVDVMSESDLNRLMNIIHTKNIGWRVKSLVVASVTHRLSRLDNQASLTVRQKMLDKHVFNMNW